MEVVTDNNKMVDDDMKEASETTTGETEISSIEDPSQTEFEVETGAANKDTTSNLQTFFTNTIASYRECCRECCDYLAKGLVLFIGICSFMGVWGVGFLLLLSPKLGAFSFLIGFFILVMAMLGHKILLRPSEGRNNQNVGFDADNAWGRIRFLMLMPCYGLYMAVAGGCCIQFFAQNADLNPNIVYYMFLVVSAAFTVCADLVTDQLDKWFREHWKARDAVQRHRGALHRFNN
jgi:hypothetical protein